MSILELNQVSYSYEKKGNQVLSDISYSFEKGKLYAITGRSGAGKTTLLSLICGLATPTSGSILLNGKDISSLNRYDYRSHDIGVIFQSFNLLPKLTARENVILSMDIAGYPCEDKKEHRDLCALLKEFYAKERYLAAICAAPTVFGELGFLEGRKACCYPGMESGLSHAETNEEPVNVDGHMITSRGLGTAIPFALKLIELLCGKEKAEEIGHGVVYY